MNILFVCKYNKFRSRIAEAYLKKINKNKDIKAESAGLIEGIYPLEKEQVEVAKEMGLNIEGKPKALSSRLLKNQDLIVLVANDVPPIIFRSIETNKKTGINVINLNIPDVASYDKKDIEKTIKTIMKEIDKLVNNLEKK